MEVPESPISRRTTLKSLGVSGALFGFTPKISAEESIGVPIVKHRDKVLKRKEISQDWWDHVLETRQKRQDLKDNIGDSEEVHSVSTTTNTDITIDGHWGRKIKLKLDESKIRDPGSGRRKDLRNRTNINIPQRHNGVDVEVVSVNHKNFACQNDADFTPVEGGVATTNQSGGGNCAWATIGGAVAHLSDITKSYVITAEHAFTIQGDVYQWNSYLGSPTGYRDSDLDYQVIEVDESRSITWEIENADYSVGGHVVNLEVWEDNNEVFDKMGATTGGGSGQIKDCCNDSVTIDGVGGVGDSGGPVYTYVDVNGTWYTFLAAIIIGGPASITYNCDGCSKWVGTEFKGTPAEAIRDHDDDVAFGLMSAPPQ